MEGSITEPETPDAYEVTGAARLRVDNAGFSALWGTLIDEARRTLFSEHPTEVAAFYSMSGPFEDHVSRATKLGMRQPHAKALEAGMACRRSRTRIANVLLVAERLDHNGPLAAEIESALMDSMNIYLSAYLDGLREFTKQTINHLVRDDRETQKRREEAYGWCAEAKKSLSNTRQPVAHAGTRYISGITDDGLWPPMILAGALAEQALDEGFLQEIATGHEKFKVRMDRLQEVAVMAVTEGERQMLATATMIRDKIGKKRGR